MHNTLESSKYFPYIAWTLVVGFAMFTYTLTTRMQENLSDISVSVERLETKIDTMGTRISPQDGAVVPHTGREVQ